ncbi:MAG: hypothetical protein GEV13_03075 [Rhodospirillales bacterium]|nr:hypothetical protein [Rhodospirillales bacterium]
MLGIALIVGGIERGFLAWSVREAGKPWGWVAVSALITLLLGLIIVAKWPYSSAYTLGIFLGIDLIFIGSSWLGIGLALKKQVAWTEGGVQPQIGQTLAARPFSGPLAGGVQRGNQVIAARAVVGPTRALLRPGLAPAVAQPEDAGPRIGRIVHDVLEGPLFALMQHRALDRAAAAHRALVEAARHPRIGDDPALAHRFRKRRMAGDPVVDGARRDVEEARQLRIGGAQQAIVVGELAEFTAVGGGTSGSGHNR